MHILSHVARFMGWNPIGISVTVRVDESGNPSMVGAELTAVIASINDDGSFVLRLTKPLLQGDRSLQEVTGYPRNKGFDVYHMAFGAIAVYLSPREGNASDQRFASAFVERRSP